MTPKRRSSWQRWLFAALVVGFLWVLAKRFADIQQLIGTLTRGDWRWISVAIGLEIVYYLVFAAMFQKAFGLTDITTRYRDLIPIAFAFLFANTTTASGGTAGLALFVDDVRRRGGSGAKATAATLLAHTANYGMFAALLALGLLFLYVQHDLTGLEVISALLLFLLVLGLCSVLVLGLRWPDLLRRLLALLQQVVTRLAGWLKRPSPLPDNWADKNAADFIAASQAIAAHPSQLAQLLLIALLTHGVHILVLLTLFAAYGQPATPGLLLAGYTLTILFMIISPTPNGIGVVETIVPIVYSSLDVPSESGITITLAFRGITFWIPMVVGFILLRQLKMFGGSGRSLAESGQVRLIAVLTALMGLLNVLTAVQPDLLGVLTPLTQFSPIAVRQGSWITGIITGFLLLILANGLWRHKRMAWRLSLVVIGLSVAIHLLQSDLMAAALGILLILFLISQRSHFVARSDPPSAWQGVQVLLAALLFTLAYGTIGYYLLARYAGRPFDILSAWQNVLLLFTTLTEPTLQPLTAYEFFGDSIFIVGLVTLSYALFMLLRPVLLRPQATEQERRQAQQVAAAYGQTPLAAFIPLPDRAYFFSSGGSVITYMHQRHLAIALGEPVGPQSDGETAVAEFLAFCRQHDWEAAFYRVSPTAQARFEEAGFETLAVGQEAIAPLQAGIPPAAHPQYQSHMVFAPFTEALTEQMRLVSDSWLAQTGANEQPFTADRFSRAYLQHAAVALLRDNMGEIVVVASAYPTPNKRDLALGLLRYQAETPAAAVQQLLQALAYWGASVGYDRLYLGMKPLPETAVSFSARSVWDHLWQRLYLRRRLQSRRPPAILPPDTLPVVWTPQFLAYSHASSLPAISAALFPDLKQLAPDATPF